MKLRKGVVPLIIFAIAAGAYAIYVFVSGDPAPMERPGESIFRQP